MANNIILFDQATAQVNFLLVAQRNMILVTAFALTLATFVKNFNYPFISQIIIILFLYSIAVGIKSATDFDTYVKDVITESDVGEPLDSYERKLLNRWYEWIYFTYTLIILISGLLLIYLNMEFFKIYIPGAREAIVNVNRKTKR